MTENDDGMGEILEALQKVRGAGVKVEMIVIHDAMVWSRLPQLGGTNLTSNPLAPGQKLFDIPVRLGRKNDQARFTFENIA